MSQSNEHRNNITVLFDGYAEVINQTTMLANCTCTLVRGKDTCIIVDTRTAWDGNEIVSGMHYQNEFYFVFVILNFYFIELFCCFFFSTELKKYNVNTDDITHVVCTHGHSDHIGCNYLFVNAKEHIVGRAISNKDEYRAIEDDTKYIIDDGIYVLATPGHTLDSVTLICENSNLSDKPVAICGDLFEKREDCDHELIWIGAGSDSIETQRKNRLLIAEMASIIIPGHGPKFDITDEIITKLRGN